MNRTGVFTAALIVLVALAGCTPETPTPTSTMAAPPPTTSATPLAAPTPIATPTPTPAPAGPAALVVPGCDGLLTLEQAIADSGNERYEFIGEFGVDDIDAGHPWTGTAQHAASPVRLCVWGVPSSDAGFRVTVGQLAEPDRAALVASLEGAGYSSVTMGTVTAMEYESFSDAEVGGTHLFTGGVWINVPGFHPSFTGTIAGQVLDSMRTANPTLGL